MYKYMPHIDDYLPFNFWMIVFEINSELIGSLPL